MVPLTRVSRWLRLAVVDVEDARFYQHNGVDLRAMARAAVRGLDAGRVVEGGSTITQQYVKNACASNERSLRRKLREAGLALLQQAGLYGRVTTTCDTDADAAAPRPGLVWKAAPGPGGQVELARPVELWVNPPGCAPAPATTAPPGPTTTTRP